MAIMKTLLHMEHLFDHNLKFKEDRIGNMVHLIRLSAVLSWMGDVMVNRTTPEFLCMDRYVPSPPLVY